MRGRLCVKTMTSNKHADSPAWRRLVFRGIDRNGEANDQPERLEERWITLEDGDPFVKIVLRRLCRIRRDLAPQHRLPHCGWRALPAVECCDVQHRCRLRIGLAQFFPNRQTSGVLDRDK